MSESDTDPPASRVRWQFFLLATALGGLAFGGLLQLLQLKVVGSWLWMGTTVLVLGPTIVSSIRRLLKGEAGVDLIAVLAMGGALVLGQSLAGAIIAVMLTGGAALERFAENRAHHELTSLLKRAPRIAHRRTGDQVTAIDVNLVVPGDQLVVAPGEVIPTDGLLLSPVALLDESALTGEAKPVELKFGAQVRSGGTNAGEPFELRATALAEKSTYAAIIRLVRAAEESKAPFLRLADRYALAFLLLTLVIAVAAWLLTGDPVRGLAVLVVATPCPLILAAPAAIVAGLSQAARRGIIVKGGGPLEALARVKVVLLDKTGTLTVARPEVVEVEAFGTCSRDELIRLAASVEQLSVHPYAPAITDEAQSRGLELLFPTEVHEQMGTGISGRVDGKVVSVGQFEWVAPGSTRSREHRAIEIRTSTEGSSSVYVAIEGQLAGAFILQDLIRAEAPRALHELRALGVGRIHMVTGDHPDVAELVGDALGIDRIFAERTPAEKLEVVRQARAEGLTLMVGDGINDAPALALADVGVAMGARGATAASEAADVVLTVDRLEGLAVAIRIAKRTRCIALESVFVGMGLSFVAMVAAALGRITPIVGAVLQEGIDVLVILNALRALGGGALRRRSERVPGLSDQLAAAHRTLRPHIRELASLASRLEELTPGEAKLQLERTRDMLEKELLPHEREEQESAYPVIGRMLRTRDPTWPLIQTHHEISRLTRLYGRLIAQLPAEGPQPEDLHDIRRALYGLSAILSLHFSQEDEFYTLLDA